MEIKAQAKFQRIAPKKARTATCLIRGKSVLGARKILEALPKKSAGFVLKVLNSAEANAKNNKNLKSENLIVKEAYVDGGPTLKRWRPRAFGRASLIMKRTSHISVVLESIEPEKSEGSKNKDKKSSAKDAVSGDASKKSKTSKKTNHSSKN